MRYALPGSAARIAEGFDELDVLARARRGYLDNHVATVATPTRECNNLTKVTCPYNKIPPLTLSHCFTDD